VLNCTLFHLHWLSFVVAKRTILLSFQTISSPQVVLNLKYILSKTLSKITLISPTVVKQLFYAGYQAMSTFWAMRGLTLQPNQLFRCPLHEAPSRWTFFLRSPFCLNEWQEIWDCCEGNKLHSIYPTVGSVEHSKNISRNDSVLINRLHVGHSRLTHTYCVVMIHLLVNRVDFCFRETHLGWMCRLVQNILRPLLLGSYFKVSTILRLLILLKKPIFITTVMLVTSILY